MVITITRLRGVRALGPSCPAVWTLEGNQGGKTPHVLYSIRRVGAPAHPPYTVATEHFGPLSPLQSAGCAARVGLLLLLRNVAPEYVQARPNPYRTIPIQGFDRSRKTCHGLQQQMASFMHSLPGVIPSDVLPPRMHTWKQPSTQFVLITRADS